MSTKHGPDRPRTIVVGLYDFTLDRPEAPLATVGPFADAKAAAEYIAHWQPQLRLGVSLKAGAIPEPERLASHMANIGAFADDPTHNQCPHKPDGESWCCLRRAGHDGDHVFHADRLLEAGATAGHDQRSEETR
jgi:hypothetical protein